MVVMECVDGECDYKTGDLSEAVALECLKLHVRTKHETARVMS